MKPKLRFFRRISFRDLFPRFWLDWNGDILTASLSWLSMEPVGDSGLEWELRIQMSSTVMEWLAPRWERWRARGWVD